MRSGRGSNAKALVLHAIPNLDDLGRAPELARDLPPTAIAALIAKCAAIQAALAAALAEISTDGHGALAPRAEADQLLTVEQTAALLNSKKDWVYRHAAELPFAVRVGGQLRFSAEGLQRYIRAKTIKPAV